MSDEAYWMVVCDNYRMRFLTEDEAKNRAAEVDAFGHCELKHEVVKVEPK